ncbi:MAG: metal ABC transporter permease [Nitrospirae bacterium]|nr:metal ABC transporter permease [Nitrospirota bacterium]
MDWLRHIPLLSRILLVESNGMSFLDAMPLLYSGILACTLAALVSSFLGVFIVLKRIVFVSAALSQVSALGIAISIVMGLFFGVHFTEGEQSGFLSVPALVSFLFAVVAALLLAIQVGERKITRESIVGISYVLPAGLVLLILDKVAVETHEIDNILFGNAVFVSDKQLFLLAGASLLIFAIHALLHKEFLFSSFDAESARAMGIKAVAFNQLLYFTFALAISISISAIGALPVFSFMVIPATSALLVSDHIKRVFVLATIFGLLSALFGFYFSFVYSLPTGSAMLTVSSFFLLPGLLRRYFIK